ncbi:NUDIX hydrolase [Algivirga pacifica]|uniref:NUDIX hydrolase n=1 Tax=Algivirga pacifica TaxID=1162670 RepID=A0ABP9D9X5_9BACT
MNFCSHCGSNALKFEIPAGDTHHRFVCDACGTIHYQNPRIIVGCIPIYEGKVLLARRAIEPREGLWNLPAGFLENGERAEEGARREVKEETDALVEVVRLHTIFDLPEFNQVYLHFLAEMQAPHFASKTSESLEVRLFEEKDIPWEEIAFASTTFALQRYFENPTTENVHRGVFYKYKAKSL